jgi:hypothetical protein
MLDYNGDTYNLGHRHPELIETLEGALDHFDIGNHWFPSVARTCTTGRAVDQALSIRSRPNATFVDRCSTPDQYLRSYRSRHAGLLRDIRTRERT